MTDKFASRSRRCILVGYPYGKKGWKLYDLETKKNIISRDVDFYENEFPFASTVLSSNNDVEKQIPMNTAFDDDEVVVRGA